MPYGRIKAEELFGKVTTAEQAAQLFENGMVVGASGFTKAGDSKVVLDALARRAEQENIRITLMTGASLGHDTDGKLTRAGALAKRMPFQVDRVLRQAINNGEVLFIDQHLSESAELLHNRCLPAVDIAVIEAAFIERDGSIVPTTSVGNSVTFAALAKKVIIEINTKVPESIYGLHDIFQPENYPHRNVIPVVAPENRIGRRSIPLDINKIAAIVFTDIQDSPADISPPDGKTVAIARHLLRFFEAEVEKGHLTDRLLPIQAGIGKVAKDRKSDGEGNRREQ